MTTTSTSTERFYCLTCDRYLDGGRDRDAHELVIHGGRNVTRRAESADPARDEQG